MVAKNAKFKDGVYGFDGLVEFSCVPCVLFNLRTDASYVPVSDATFGSDGQERIDADVFQ